VATGVSAANAIGGAGTAGCAIACAIPFAARERSRCSSRRQSSSLAVIVVRTAVSCSSRSLRLRSVMVHSVPPCPLLISRGHRSTQGLSTPPPHLSRFPHRPGRNTEETKFGRFPNQGHSGDVCVITVHPGLDQEMFSTCHQGFQLEVTPESCKDSYVGFSNRTATTLQPAK